MGRAGHGCGHEPAPRRARPARGGRVASRARRDCAIAVQWRKRVCRSHGRYPCRQLGPQVEPPAEIAVAVLRGIRFVESLRDIEAERQPRAPAAGFGMSDEFVLPFGFFPAAAILAAARDVAVKVAERHVKLRRAVEGQIEIDRAAHVAADGARERIERDRRRSEAAPLEGAPYGPGQQPNADQRKHQGDQGQVVLILHDFPVGDERRDRRDGVPERGERPRAPHCRPGARADLGRLPGVIQEPGRLPVLHQRRVFFVRAHPRVYKEAEPDAAEDEKEDRLEADRVPNGCRGR